MPYDKRRKDWRKPLAQDGREPKHAKNQLEIMRGNELDLDDIPDNVTFGTNALPRKFNLD